MEAGGEPSTNSHDDWPAMLHRTQRAGQELDTEGWAGAGSVAPCVGCSEKSVWFGQLKPVAVWSLLTHSSRWQVVSSAEVVVMA